MRLSVTLLLMCVTSVALSQDLQFHQAIQIGGGSDDALSHMMIDDLQNLFVSGKYANQVDFDPGPGVVTPPLGFNNTFLAKYDIANNLV